MDHLDLDHLVGRPTISASAWRQQFLESLPENNEEDDSEDTYPNEHHDLEKQVSSETNFIFQKNKKI